MSSTLRSHRLGHSAALSIAAALLWVFGAPGVASAQLEILFDSGQQIFDGLPGDLDGLVNDKIDFAGIYGTAGYNVQGTLRQSPTWPSGPSLTGYSPPIIGALTLTNFTAEAVSTSTLNQTLGIRFRDTFPGTYGSGTAVDSISAEVGNSLLFPVPPNTDQLVVWNSWISDIPNGTIPIIPATGGALPQGNPFHPGPGTTPYLISGNGPTPIPPMTNPVLEGLLVINLGQFNDQFILPSCAEIGFTPEPASLSTIAVVVLAAGMRAARLIRLIMEPRRSSPAQVDTP